MHPVKELEDWPIQGAQGGKERDHMEEAFEAEAPREEEMGAWTMDEGGREEEEDDGADDENVDDEEGDEESQSSSSSKSTQDSHHSTCCYSEGCRCSLRSWADQSWAEQSNSGNGGDGSFGELSASETDNGDKEGEVGHPQAPPTSCCGDRNHWMRHLRWQNEYPQSRWCLLCCPQTART